MTAILIRKKRARGSPNFSGSANELTSNGILPPANLIKEDLVLGVLSAGKSVIQLFLSLRDTISVFFLINTDFPACFMIAVFARRAWQLRRFVYTADSIAFAHIGHDEVLDRIPLHEVIAVERAALPATQSAVTGLVALESAIDFSRSLQIRTIPDGYNSGRKYFLQAGDDSVCVNLVSTLQSLVRSAVFRSKSPGQRRQELVRRIYNSNAFQSIAAVLIILVRMTFGLFCCFVELSHFLDRTSLRQLQKLKCKEVFFRLMDRQRTQAYSWIT
jgi:hypothetical protein